MTATPDRGLAAGTPTHVAARPDCVIKEEE